MYIVHVYTYGYTANFFKLAFLKNCQVAYKVTRYFETLTFLTVNCECEVKATKFLVDKCFAVFC